MTGAGSRGGYALATVLAAVALVTLVFASAASALAGLATAARRAAEGADFQRKAMSAEAEALVAAATSPFSVDGLRIGDGDAGPGPPSGRSPLRLDGRPYAWGGESGLRVSLQDHAGLLNLDSSRPDTLLRLFARLGLTAQEAETLRDRLLDALDADTDRRPRGAEPADYAARGRPPPPRPLNGLAEADDVLDWATLMAGPRRAALERWAVADPGSQTFNVNTAPPEVLELVLNVDRAAATRMLAVREAAPVTFLTQLGLPLGEPSSQPVRPNGRIRFTLADTRRGWAYRSELAPGGGATGAPWAASQASLLKTQPARSSPDAPALPDPTRPPPSR